MPKVARGVMTPGEAQAEMLKRGEVRVGKAVVPYAYGRYTKPMWHLPGGVATDNRYDAVRAAEIMDRLMRRA